MRVFDMVAAVLVVAVVVEIAGSVGAALGHLQVTFNQDGGSPLSLPPIPLFQRLLEATGWAGPVTGLMLMAAVGAVVLPRLAWEDGSEPWPPRAGRLLAAVGVLAVLTVAAGLLGAVNWVWEPGSGGPRLVYQNLVPLAQMISGVLLAGAVAVVTPIARRYAEPEVSAAGSDAVTEETLGA